MYECSRSRTRDCLGAAASTRGSDLPHRPVASCAVPLGVLLSHASITVTAESKESLGPEEEA